MKNALEDGAPVGEKISTTSVSVCAKVTVGPVMAWTWITPVAVAGTVKFSV
jgi:hypothetical protein